tara:strand:+ start:10866 stop:14846 length:3981 start_codon:yes stop_codon:yes gene_type:complete
MAIDGLHGKRINTVKKKRTKKRLSGRYRNSFFGAMKQMASEANTPKASPTGPFKGIVIRVESECGGAATDTEGGSWLKYWYETTMESQPPELIKCKIRIPGVHSYIPDPEKYGCDPGPWQKVIDLHPTFTASSQDIPAPAVGDMMIVDFSDPESESDPIIISSVVVRESDSVVKGGDCPSEDKFDSAEKDAPLAATSEEGDAAGGTESAGLPASSFPGSGGGGAGMPGSPSIGDDGRPYGSAGGSLPMGSSPTSPLDAARAGSSGGIDSPLPPVIGRNEDGTPNEIALPGNKKGIFITADSLGNAKSLESPIAAIKRARWAGIGFVAIEATVQGPPAGTARNPLMRNTELEKLKKYVRAFRSVGINVYLWGTPWRGMSREFVRYMSRACVRTGSHGIIMSPSWGYFKNASEGYKKYASQAKILTEAMMSEAVNNNFVVGFTTPWNPAAAYKVNTTDYSVRRYRDCFPYACFSNVDFAVAQLLSSDGGALTAFVKESVASSAIGGAVYAGDDPSRRGEGIRLSDETGTGKYTVWPKDKTSAGTNARESSSIFAQGIEDYVNYGFTRIIPAFGAMGSNYQDYGYDTRKPPERIEQEIGFIRNIDNDKIRARGLSPLSEPMTPNEGPELPATNPWDNQPEEDATGFYGMFNIENVLPSVMWWDWAGANDNNPCWDNTRWNVIRDFNSYSLSAELAAIEGGIGKSRQDTKDTEEYNKAMRGVEMFKRVATKNGWLTQSEAAQISPKISKAPAMSVLTATTMSELETMAESAVQTLKSSDTELGSEFGQLRPDQTPNLDLTAPEGAFAPLDTNVIDYDISHFHDAEEAHIHDGAKEGVNLDLPSYINYNNPADPWAKKGGWCPVHGYTTGKGMTKANRQPSDIYYVMIHTTAGTSQEAGFGWFQNPQCGASTHYGVNTGGYIFQGVKEQDIAWQAGEKTSHRPGPPDKMSGKHNSNGIGIEIAGTLDGEKGQPGRFYSEEMYDALAYLIASICARNSISVDRNHILGHDEVRKDKVDPGGNLNELGIGPNRSDGPSSYKYDSLFDYDKLFGKIEEFFAGAGVPSPDPSGFPTGAPAAASSFPPGSAGGGGCGPGGGAGAAGSNAGGTNPATIMPLSEVADTTPASALESGAFSESSVDPPGIVTLYGVRERNLVAADISELPDGPELTFDYTVDRTNYGKTSPTKVIDQLPIATDLAHYLWAMIKAAEKDGIPLKLNSVWRNSPDINAGGSGAGAWKYTKGQQTFYDQNCSGGSCSPATAGPGRSKHQLGIAVDIANTTPVGSAVFEWLSKNAESFGFYRSVSSERWHWVLDPAKSKYAKIASDHSSWVNS